MRSAKRIILAAIVVVGLLIAAFIAFTIISNNHCVSEIAKSLQPFDAKKWTEAGAKGASSAQQEYRISAIEDLLAHKNFKGQTKAQLIELLGEPTQTDKLPNYDMIYWLGPDRSCMRMDSEWLVFTLKNGQVESYSVIVD